MTETPPPQPPPLPAALTGAWPVIVAGTTAWSLSAIAAFLIPGMDGWRPMTLAGLGVGLLGTGIFLWQRDAARRGARGAQTGLGPPDDRDRQHAPN